MLTDGLLSNPALGARSNSPAPRARRNLSGRAKADCGADNIPNGPSIGGCSASRYHAGLHSSALAPASAPLVCRVEDRRGLTPSSNRGALGTSFLLRRHFKWARFNGRRFGGLNALLSRASCSLVLVQKVTHGGAFRYPGRQLNGIGGLETGSAICAFGIDGDYAFEGCGADLPTLSFCAKRSQHQRRLHLRNIGAEEAAKNHAVRGIARQDREGGRKRRRSGPPPPSPGGPPLGASRAGT